MTKALERPERESFILLTFYHGDALATQERYTDWDQDFTGYTSEPRLSLEIPENGGTFEKNELKIAMPLDSFTTRASSGIKHSPIFVVIEEVTQGLFTGDQNDQKVLYRGRVMRTIKNYQGVANKMCFFCLPVKARLDIAMGLPCNHHCAWTLFKGGCGVNEGSFALDTQIDSVDGREVTISDAGVTNQGNGDPRYWKRGYMRKDGLRIAIRDYDWDTDPTKFYMADTIPADWVGGTNDIHIVPGCTKDIETCRDRFNAEQFFLGLGYAIPAYNPIFESK